MKNIQFSLCSNERVLVRTDCKALVEALAHPEQTGADFRYPQELLAVHRAAARFPHGVEFEHVYADAGLPGNECATALARAAAETAAEAASKTASTVSNASG